MNVKEIAKLTGKTERSIRLWIGKTSEITSGLSSEIISGLKVKISAAEKTKKPADFTLEEVIEIIRAGGNETLANLLSENANSNKITQSLDTNSRLDRIELMMEKLIQLQIKENIQKPEEQRRLPFSTDDKLIVDGFEIIQDSHSFAKVRWHGEEYLVVSYGQNEYWSWVVNKNDNPIKMGLLSKYKALEWIKNNL